MMISVLIPCYNCAQYVGEAIDSVLAQDFADVEIVVTDDGSTDSSSIVLSRYEALGVRVLRRENGGAASARNAAFLDSTGDAVLFMDADDLIATGHISALASRLDRDDVIAMGEWDRFFIAPSDAVFPPRPTYRDASGPDWLVGGGWSMMQSGTFLLPRALIENCGGWNERLSLIDDFEFFVRLIARSEGVRFASGARLYYRSGVPGSLSGRKSRAAIESELQSLMLGISHLLNAEDSLRTRLASANILQSFDYDHYPHHPDLRAKARIRVAELGGANIEPAGPPRFHMLRRAIGWRAARLVQQAMGR